MLLFAWPVVLNLFCFKSRYKLPWSYLSRLIFVLWPIVPVAVFFMPFLLKNIWFLYTFWYIFNFYNFLSPSEMAYKYWHRDASRRLRTIMPIIGIGTQICIAIDWFQDAILKSCVLQESVNKLYLLNKQVDFFQNHQFCI